MRIRAFFEQETLSSRRRVFLNLSRSLSRFGVVRPRPAGSFPQLTKKFNTTPIPDLSSPCRYPVAVVDAVAPDRLYHPEYDPFKHRRNEGRGLCFLSPWRRDTRSPTVAVVSAAAGVADASGAAVDAAAAVPAMAVVTLAVAAAPSAAVAVAASHLA